MATRSTITIKRADGTTTSIYCHWDGYIEHNGVILQLAYNTAEKVEKLLELGDLSSLGYYTEPTTPEHSFDTAEPDVCVAYCRDRGEEFMQSSGKEQFNYIFDEREAVWYVEDEVWEDETSAGRYLQLDGYFHYRTRLLLDAIDEVQDKLLVDWHDDEFATADMVFSECKLKALEARRPVIDEKLAAYEAHYRAYCD